MSLVPGINRLLVANRGEIAIRAFRAANELGMRSVAIYAAEDRDSAHRLKADEAYQVGVPGHPVSSYLDPAAVVELATRVGADAVYPGYGFMSENPRLAAACAEAGIVFVGPPTEVLRLAGDKTRARDAARAAGIPVLAASAALTDADHVLQEARRLGFPLLVKAAHGGGGRGMRLVIDEDEAALLQAVDDASREAAAGFGNGTVYLEQALIRPRHIEVQVLADQTGQCVHLYERDCSLQRRYQKVVEITPAPNLDSDLRDRICDDAIRFARHVNYVNAGTVEFLLDPATGRHAFIEMNPRIQVEHSVTEETTDVDLVCSQLQIAGGATLEDLGLEQDRIRQRGVALQCRITTEDPAQEFRPDSGRITAYRAPGGAGIRLDDGGAYAGAEVTPFFDPLLVKISARGPDLQTAASRARRAVQEMRARGVTTNQSFVIALLQDPDFLAGRIYTTFVDEHPELTAAYHGADRATRLLSWLADVTVNRENPPRSSVEPSAKLPAPIVGPAPAGSRDELKELGASAFARQLRERRAIALTDTTFRDAHQSLLATRMRTADLLAVAPHVAWRLPSLLSLEVWGGATYDVALRFLHEDPWDRLAAMREAVPNLCLQMLLRGRNLLGYSRFPDRVIEAFVREAASTGIDIFRIFDALNNIDGMRVAIAATLEANAVAEGTICYTGDLSDPTEQLYTLDYYLRIAEQLVDAGAHILAIKDMAGLLRPQAARALVGALRREFDLPVHLHTHDTAGGQVATYLAAVEAGVDAVDGAAAPLAGTTSQPSLSAIVAATAGTSRDSGLELDALLDLEPYWEAVREMYAPFETGLKAPTGRVYRHEMPGGQISNLRQQAAGIGVGDHFEQVEKAYERANAILGDVVKVTPSSKVVGDLALFLVSAGVDVDEFEANPGAFDLPDSVIAFLRGELGEPAGGFPQPFTNKALAGREPVKSSEPPSSELESILGAPGSARRRGLSAIQFPGPLRDYEAAARRFGPLTVLPTRAFFHGLEVGREITVDLAPGVRIVYLLEAIGEPDERGMRTVVVRVNGQLRPIEVKDRAVAEDNPRIQRADPSIAGHVAAPVAGLANVCVAVGEQVRSGQPILTLEAMKMESTITAPTSGTVRRIVAESGVRVDRGDLLMVID